MPKRRSRLGLCDKLCNMTRVRERPVKTSSGNVQGYVCALSPSLDGHLTELLARLTAALADRYGIDRELGRGGMAMVYLARDLRHRRPVALKVLHPELAYAVGGDRFLREIEVAANLTHPHILPLHDSGEADGLLYYVMPYVEGESLRDRLNRETQLPVDEALQIAREVADALAYAHVQGVIHRDIKPENILLSGGHALVADFGIARALGQVSARLTETGMAVGTAAYMSPEQASGERQLDGRSDIYSLGGVLYEMLAGEPPYTGPTAQAIIAKRFSEPVPRVRHVRPSVPERVEHAITRALAAVPADRFATGADLVRALATPPASLPTSAATPILGRPTTARPTRRMLALGLITGLGLIVGAGGLLWQRTHRGSDPRGPTRLAVLPFENQGEQEDEYFADGMTDAVRGKLSALAGLEVIARASSMSYRQTKKTPQEVARELRVRYLLTGTVRWAKIRDTSRVQVSPELVEVRETGAPASKWQQPFDAALTDVFQVQAEIAGRVAQALNLALGAQDQQQLAQRPTADLVAYDAFLKGEAAAHALAAEDLPSFRRAAAFYEKAVARDSTFGLAWARLADAYALLYGYGAPSPARADATRRALANAEHFAPTAPETYRARAEYEELVQRDFTRALAAAEAGLARAPDHSELTAISAIQEWRLGLVEAAVARLERARTVDPRSLIVLNYLGVVLCYQRRWSEARLALDHALVLEPTNLTTLDYLALTYVAKGDLAGARRVLAEAAPAVDRADLAADLATNELSWVLDEAAQQQLLTLPPSQFDDNQGTWGVVRAELYHLRGDTVMARVYADSARIAFEAHLRGSPADGQQHSYRGLALAYLGQRGEAIAAGERGAALLPISRDGIWGPRVQHRLLRVYLLVGEPEKALDQLEPLLKIPYYLSPGWLKIDPTFAPLRGNPRFERLMNGS